MKKNIFFLIVIFSFLFAQEVDSNKINDSLLFPFPSVKVINYDSLANIKENEKINDLITKDSTFENTDSILTIAKYYRHFLDSLVDFEKTPKMFAIPGFYNSFYHYYNPLPFEKYYKIDGFEVNSYIVKDFHILQYTSPFYNFEEKSILNFYNNLYFVDVPYLQLKLGSNRTNKDDEYALVKLKNGKIVDNFNFELSFLGQSGKWNSFSKKDDGEDRAYSVLPKFSYKNDFFAIFYEYNILEADVPYKKFFAYTNDTLHYHFEEKWEAQNLMFDSKYLEFGYKHKEESYKLDTIALDTSNVIDNYFVALKIPFYNQNLSFAYNYFEDEFCKDEYFYANADLNLFDKLFFNAYYAEDHQNFNFTQLIYKNFGVKAIYIKDKFNKNLIYVLDNFFDVNVEKNEEKGVGLCYKNELSEIYFIYGKKKISFEQTIGKNGLIDTVCNLENKANYFEIKANYYKDFSLFGEDFKIYVGNTSKYFAKKYLADAKFSEVNFLPSYLTETSMILTKYLSHNNAISIGVDYQFYSNFYLYYNPIDEDEKKTVINTEIYSLYFILNLTRQFDIKLEIKNPKEKEQYYDLMFDNPEFLITINWYMYN